MLRDVRSSQLFGLRDARRPSHHRGQSLEAGVVASAAAALPAGALAAEHPNLVLLVIDTLRAHHVGVYVGRARNPNIDSLARAGLRFTCVYPEAMATIPAR
jgi:hypothetical protein